MAVLLRRGIKLWPGITLGAFLANFLTGANVAGALGIGVGNTLEAVAGTILLRRYVRFNESLEELKDVLGLAFWAGMLSTTISATIGVASLYFTGTITSSLIKQTWATWWIGDMISALVVTPVLLIWSRGFSVKFKLKIWMQIGIIALFLITVSAIIFGDIVGAFVRGRPLAYLAFPPLIWTALYFSQRGTVMVVLVLSLISIISTFHGQGPFAAGAVNENLLFLQLFLSVISITGMVMAAVIAERKKHESRKDEFISIAAHELKTPLTSIQGYMQLLRQLPHRDQDKKALLYLERASIQVDNLTKLVRDFLDASKVPIGKLQLSRENFEIDEMIKEVTLDAASFIRGREIHVTNLCGKKVFADRFRISQVLMNLLSNAAKFSRQRQRINVSVQSDSNYVTVAVKDVGVGIAKSDINLIFERFFQVDVEHAQGDRGLGLGLYISKEIISRHGCKIWVESEAGKGSTFFFSLPIR